MATIGDWSGGGAAMGGATEWAESSRGIGSIQVIVVIRTGSEAKDSHESEQSTSEPFNILVFHNLLFLSGLLFFGYQASVFNDGFVGNPCGILYESGVNLDFLLIYRVE